MTVRSSCRVRVRVLALGALACLPSLVLAAPKPPARKASPARKPPAAPADFASQFASAVGLYERFDYEHALASFTQAQTLARGVEQEVPVALYLGIVHAELGNRDQCLSSFRTALYLRPDATLPVKVSPRVQSDFEDVRKAVTRDLGLTPAAAAPVSPPVTADRPVSPPADKAPDLSAPTRSQASYLPSLHSERSARVPVLSLALLGTGALAGGGALFFGLESRNEIGQAHDADLLAERLQHLETARKRALVANVLIGTASAAAVLGAMTYFFSPGSAPAPAAASSGGATP